MDYRLYILAGLFLFLVLSLVILIAATARARKAPSTPVEPAAAGSWPMLNPAPPSAEADARETFSEPTTGVAAVLSEPIRTGSWRPETPPSPTRAATRSDYWDSLVEEPGLLLREDTRPPRSTPVQDTNPVTGTAPAPAPVSEKHAEEMAEEAPAVPAASDEPPVVAADPGAAPGPAPPTAPQVDTENVAVVVDRAQQDAEIDHLIEVLVEEPPETLPAEVAVAEPTPPTRPAPPSPPSAPTPPTVESPPQLSKPPAEPTAAGKPPVAEGPVPDTVPAPPPAPELKPDPPPTPEPERASPPVAQAVPAAPPDPGTKPAPAVDPEPARPASSRPAVVAKTARITAATASRPVGQPRADVPSARRAPAQPERPRATVASAKPDDAPTHELVAPVEMWFGDDRVGVKPGSRTYDLFQKYATVLFDDLRRSRSSTLV